MVVMRSPRLRKKFKMTSPYVGVSPEHWSDVTRQLIERHPLKAAEIVEVVLASWNSIFDSRMGSKGFRIGVDIHPKPQIMGFFLHELIPLELHARYPGVWRGEKSAADKDIVYIPDDSFSIEVKTSSNAEHIYGNRSYAQEGSSRKKSKTGYYLAVNFCKFGGEAAMPVIRLIRFGWLDAADWVGQAAETGQQSRLSSSVENGKLLRLYPAC